MQASLRSEPIRVPFLLLCLATASCMSSPPAEPVRLVDPRPQAEQAEPAGQASGATAPGETGEHYTQRLAEAAQNPIASMISLPIQNNTDFDNGPQNATVNTSNIQPVWPFAVSEDWNLITRTILPIVYQEEIVLGTGGSEFGLGDTNFTTFFSPSKTEGFTWGVGPSILLPTATDPRLGPGEWGAGLGVIGLVMPKPWVLGALVSNVWSFDGSVNSMTLQPFVNYNLPEGWYVSSVPIITANWEADSDNVWKVPLGAGVGKLIKVGNQPINLQVHYYKYVETPVYGPEWQLRLQVQFLFPK